MFASTFFVTLIGGLVTERIVEPKLGKFDSAYADSDIDQHRMEGLTATEKRALKGTGLAALALVALVAVMVVPRARFAQPGDGLVSGSPFLRGMKLSPLPSPCWALSMADSRAPCKTIAISSMPWPKA